MQIDQKLVSATIDFLNKRFNANEKEVVVAGAYLANGEMLFGVATDAFLNSACLCAETGPICEAHKLNVKLTATVCIIREDATDEIKFLTPCGLCQERLLFFGGDVSVAIPVTEKPSEWTAIKLRELQPNHWLNTMQ